MPITTTITIQMQKKKLSQIHKQTASWQSTLSLFLFSLNLDLIPTVSKAFSHVKPSFFCCWKGTDFSILDNDALNLQKHLKGIS